MSIVDVRLSAKTEKIIFGEAEECLTDCSSNINFEVGVHDYLGDKVLSLNATELRSLIRAAEKALEIWQGDEDGY